MEKKFEYIAAIRNDEGLKTFKINAIDYKAAEEGCELMATELNGVLEDIIMISDM